MCMYMYTYTYIYIYTYLNILVGCLSPRTFKGSFLGPVNVFFSSSEVLWHFRSSSEAFLGAPVDSGGRPRGPEEPLGTVPGRFGVDFRSDFRCFFDLASRPSAAKAQPLILPAGAIFQRACSLSNKRENQQTKRFGGRSLSSCA